MTLSRSNVICLKIGTPKKLGHHRNCENNFFSPPKDLKHTKNFKMRLVILVPKNWDNEYQHEIKSICPILSIGVNSHLLHIGENGLSGKIDTLFLRSI